MEYKYDKRTDTLLMKLSNDKPDFGEQKDNVITHYNKLGIPIEIEILDASATVTKLVEVVLKSKKQTV